MALLRGVWGALRTGLCAGCGGHLRPPLSFVCVPRWFSSLLDQIPKKPATKFIRFFRDQLPICKAENPEASTLDIVKEIGRRWMKLAESEKKVYEVAYKTEWAAYKEERDRFNRELTPSQREAMEREILQKRQRKDALMKKRELAELGKPKRPRSAYNIFVSEKFKDASGETFQDKIKTTCEIWKFLSASEKQVYIQLSEDDKIRYTNEMNSWEKHMTEVGRSDLLRFKRKKRRDDTVLP